MINIIYSENITRENIASSNHKILKVSIFEGSVAIRVDISYKNDENVVCYFNPYETKDVIDFLRYLNLICFVPIYFDETIYGMHYERIKAMTERRIIFYLRDILDNYFDYITTRFFEILDSI